jgi:hypothetical protein
MARRGEARRGEARRGETWRGEAGEARRGLVQSAGLRLGPQFELACTPPIFLHLPTDFVDQQSKKNVNSLVQVLE